MAATRTERERWQADLDALLADDYRRTSSELHRLYVGLLKQLKGRLRDSVDRYDSLSFSKRLEVERLFLTARDLTEALGDAGVLIGGHAAFSGAHGYAGVWYALEQVQELRVAGMGLDRRFIESLVAQPVAGRTLSQRLYRDRQKLARLVNHHVALGITEGRGYAEIARRVTDVTEASYRQALRIARTEAGRVRSEATQQAYSDAADTLGDGLGKRWLATLDGHTRHDHRYLDGQVRPWDGRFDLPTGASAEGPRLFGIAAEDINCRCSTEPVVDGKGATHRRDSMTGETITYKTYDDWAKSVVG